jgi:hypothetical protein
MPCPGRAGQGRAGQVFHTLQGSTPHRTLSILSYASPLILKEFIINNILIIYKHYISHKPFARHFVYLFQIDVDVSWSGRWWRIIWLKILRWKWRLSHRLKLNKRNASVSSLPQMNVNFQDNYKRPNIYFLRSNI